MKIDQGGTLLPEFKQWKIIHTGQNRGNALGTVISVGPDEIIKT